MSDAVTEGPSLIKMGKLANAKHFDKLAGIWPDALSSDEYTWRELLPIAGQVGRQGATDKADELIALLLAHVEDREGALTALEAARLGATQLPDGPSLRASLKRLYVARMAKYAEFADLVEVLMPDDVPLDKAAAQVDRYVGLRPGAYAIDRSQLVPGLVESLRPDTGLITVRFEDRHVEYGPKTVSKLSPRPDDYFPALVIYDPDRLRQVADEDPVAFVQLALEANRDHRLPYRELKGSVTALLGEKGWKDWWQKAKAALKRDPLIGMSAGSQPVLRRLRQADRYEDRVRREFDHRKDPMEKLVKVMGYLDEINREEKAGTCKGSDCYDADVLAHLGNGAAKIAVAAVKTNPALALAGLALHAETAARGAEVARPNPRAAAQVVGRVEDLGGLVDLLPDALLQRVLLYVRTSMPDAWGPVWSAVLMRGGRRLCDTITKGMIEGGQDEALARALEQSIARPTSSPDLLCWMWRTRLTTGNGGRYLAGRPELSTGRVAEAMFNLLDSTGKLYGMSMEEKHLKVLEMARATIAIQGSRPLLDLLDQADRREAIRLKGIIRANAGLTPAHRTQLLGFLRSKHADIFVEMTHEWEDATIVYTTEAGLRKQQNALNHIIEEEIPAVAKQIGEAASFGDLSENAEYTAALEKRDQLASNAARLESELALAQIINHEMAASDHVNVGTRVTARSGATGQEEVYTFLGPWDTIVEEKVLNYQAPLSMAFMGAKVGDTVEYGVGEDRRTWEILAIEPAV